MPIDNMCLQEMKLIAKLYIIRVIFYLHDELQLLSLFISINRDVKVSFMVKILI